MMTMNIHDIDMCVADTLRDDEIENLDSILHALNNTDSASWRIARGVVFTVEEVQTALSRLIDSGHVTPCVERPPTNEVIPLPKENIGTVEGDVMWFHLEPEGREAADHWWQTEGRVKYPLTQ
jgi:hypothetical protein